MFFKGSSHKKGSGVKGIFRLFLSLIIMVVLGVGLLQAYKHFSGFDPMRVDPKSVFSNTLNSESAFELLNGILTLNPTKSLEKAKEVLGEKKPSENISDNTVNTSNTSNLMFKFAIISDSHIDWANLGKALAQAREMDVKFVIGLGDFSDVGTVKELRASKQKFDESGLSFYATAGDHDLWDSRDKKSPPEKNFIEVFESPTYQSFNYENTKIIIIYNSDNYLGLDEAQIKWIEEEMNKVDSEKPKLTLVFAGIPLYHPSSDHVMGKTEPKLKNQAEHLTSIFKRAGVAEVIAGDTHFFSRYKHPKNDLAMTTVGAATSVRNPQAPRFTLVEVFEDGGYNVMDLEIK